jgi:putative oxidoreductase
MRGMRAKSFSRDPGIVLLRIGVAVLLFIHGVFRVVDGGVTPFGGFLGTKGIPFGPAVAWLLTVIELIGTPLLAIGLFTRPLVVWFALELAAGIVLVHAREGWFVVGGGRNGVEYSVALMVALIAVGWSERWWSRQRI